ncbi:MAG: hypothetical protein A3C46_06150 [Deltaproteobacteria bacterium RIFCSPHIGHO2_02_FULL_44_16]|nr:MAG: hypothetical protein A3C46_06150 [Deltaproteobacteria bacterium RIFCSPHIGHO2_02_FULL_44_16]
MLFKRRNERGIALMLVLTAITILTVATVEFAYNTNVTLHLAYNERDRLQAEYLAKSALQFMLLELKYDRIYQQVVQRQNLGQMLGDTANLPLCQQFPLSTGLIRAVFLGEGLEGAPLPDDVQKAVSLAQEQGAEEFLDFEGDFDAECIDESTKINLNVFATADTTRSEGRLSPYDQQIQFFIRFLKQESYKNLFEGSDIEIEDIVRNIADWVDPDETMYERGSPETSLYNDKKYPLRNGKIKTIGEVHYIAGVEDQWFGPLKEQFTIYGDGKINVCAADEEIVKALLRKYIEMTPGLPPLRLDDSEVMERLLKAISEGCSSGAVGEQLPQVISDKVQTAITAEQGNFPDQPPSVDPNQNQGKGFAELLSGVKRFYTLKLHGQVNDTSVHIHTVVDIDNSDPKNWPLLYWKVY